jgi:uncharacterized protein (TIGR03086 family)
VTTAARFRTLSAAFSDRVRAVPAERWDAPAPCEGWVARDVVRHLVEWVPGFFAGSAVRFPELPSVDDDPVGAWEDLAGAVQAALDDPEVAAAEVTSRAGTHPVETAVAMFVLPDVLVHTWDLARAAELDERLDPQEVERSLAGMGQVPEEVLVASGQFGPRVPVPEDAAPQDRLIALTGRDPGWRPPATQSFSSGA